MSSIKDYMKPCPFCGNKIENVSFDMSPYGIERIGVDCACGVQFDILAEDFIYSNSEKIRIGKDALEKWNTRTEETK